MGIKSNNSTVSYFNFFGESVVPEEPDTSGGGGGGGGTTGSNYSILLDGNDSITVPNGSGAIDIADNDFTLECFFKAQTSGSPGNHDTLFALSNYGEGGSDSGPGNSFSFYAHDNGGLKVFTRSGGSFTNRYEQGSLYSLDTWTHFAWTRNGTANRVFIDGDLDGTWTGQTNFTDGQSMYIGANDYSRNGTANEYGLTGNISQARLTIGESLYNSAFTKPSAVLSTTSQGATASNVKFLCCSESSVTAATKVTGTITSTGDPTAATGPF